MSEGETFEREVRMRHRFGGPDRVCTAVLCGTSLVVKWGVAGDVPCILSTGQLLGPARDHWTMDRDSLAFFRRKANVVRKKRGKATAAKQAEEKAS